jgi:L-alanine-DL-glutamate epimerase-like enolase superfamily enzyme
MAADVVNEPAVLDGGVIHLRNRPGFGVEIDPEGLARVREVWS